MGKIRVICSDPCGTDCSSDDDDDESIEDEKPINEKLFVQEISASIPTIPPVSTIHLDFVAKLKSDSLFRVDESESKSSGDGLHCIVLAMPALKPEDIPRKKSGIFSRLKKLSMAKKIQPDATKSSSQDDGSADANPTCINHAIHTTVAKSPTSLGPAKHPGLQITSSGKWGVRVQNPFKNAQVWVGSFSTIEEAINIYNKKKCEFASLRFADIKHKRHYMLRAKYKGKGKGKIKWRTIVVEGVTVCETLSGKWGAWIKDPVSNVKFWLGSCATPEEAAKSYNRKKLEFDSTYDHDKEVVSNTCIPAREIASSTATNFTKFEHPGVKLTNARKWGVTIQHPIRKCLLSLGSYDTPEEAAKVYDKKKLELDALLQSIEIACSTAEMANQESNYSPQKETLADVASPTVTSPTVADFESLHVKKYKGVKPTKSGRWTSRIYDPSIRKKLYLGTFDTAEEAADAYKKKRCEFDALVSPVKKQKREANAETYKKKTLKPKLKSKKVAIAEEVGKAYGKKCHLFESVILPESQTGLKNASPSFTFDAENSMVTVVNSQDSEGSNKNNKMQISGFSFAAELQENAIGIINGYGQLIGEYSKLDDDLWLTGPGDDDDCDVDGTIGGSGDLAWDHKPSPFLPN